jgi:hypothetical protein
MYITLKALCSGPAKPIVYGQNVAHNMEVSEMREQFLPFSWQNRDKMPKKF